MRVLWGFLGAGDHEKNIYSAQNQSKIQSIVTQISGIGQFLVIFSVLLKYEFHRITDFLFFFWLGDHLRSRNIIYR